MTNEKVYQMSFAKVYPLLVNKATRKGRFKEEVDEVTKWLTGYSQVELERCLEEDVCYGDFFRNAPELNPNRKLIKGSICGVKLEEIEEPLMQDIRYLDKLVDELAKGKEYGEDPEKVEKNMDNVMLVELIGYLGSGLVLVSFLMSSVVKLRIVNSVGGAVFAVYALIIHSYPTALMNVVLVGINIYYLVRLNKKDRHFDMIDGSAEDALVKYFLNYYKDDIKKYFPEWNGDTSKADVACVVCCDAVPAGILLGKADTDGSLEILLDYATPAYRDCSVGKYLYTQLAAKGVRRLTFSGKAESYEVYLLKMGFVRENDIYMLRGLEL